MNVVYFFQRREAGKDTLTLESHLRLVSANHCCNLMLRAIDFSSYICSKYLTGTSQMYSQSTHALHRRLELIDLRLWRVHEKIFDYVVLVTDAHGNSKKAGLEKDLRTRSTKRELTLG